MGAKQAISMAVVVIVGFTVNFYVAAVLTFVMVSVGGIWYHLRWRDAVDQMVAA